MPCRVWRPEVCPLVQPLHSPPPLLRMLPCCLLPDTIRRVFTKDGVEVVVDNVSLDFIKGATVRATCVGLVVCVCVCVFVCVTFV